MSGIAGASTDVLFDEIEAYGYRVSTIPRTTAPTSS